MNRSAKRILAVVVLCCVAIAAFYLGRRSAPEQVDVFTWMLWMDSSRRVYMKLEGELRSEDSKPPAEGSELSTENLNAARQQLLQAMDAAAGVLRDNPQAVEVRFGDNSPVIFDMIEQVESLVAGETDRSRWITVAVDANNQVVGIYSDLNLEVTEKEVVNAGLLEEEPPKTGENPVLKADTPIKP